MLDLYPHNLAAYNNAVVAFKTSFKTCIIHPTGTGKSLIIANFIENNPDKKHLLLAPGVHIFNEIRKHTSLHFETCTYQNLIFNTAEKLGLLDCDFIYLDEFHRIGALEWGSHLKILLKLNPNALILGTTATHIRYLDDNRNMAEEIFDNNISSAMTLQEAIQSNILQAPKYVCALYNIREVYKTLTDKILHSNHVNKKNIADQLRKSMIDWENSNGIEKILSKHLTSDRNKILVFCRTKAHIDQMESIIMDGIKKVLPNAVSLHIYSKFTSAVNEDALQKFSLEDDIPKVLFTVAMINEGLHVKGNNTVILIRDTTSPIIYFQQLGRAFSVNQTQKPLIFDLVNNFDSITGTLNDEYAELRPDDGKAHTTNKSSSLADLVEVEFIDEVKDLAQMFHAYYQLVNTWNSRFTQASLFYTQHAHLNPKNGTSLSNWVGAQRGFKRNNTLDADKIIKLESIGIIWEIDEYVWNKMFGEAQLYYKEHGHLSMKFNSRLISWLSTNRKLKAKNMLTEERFQKLESIGIIWNFDENLWNTKFEKAKAFFENNGHLKPKEKESSLYNWLNTNRILKAENILTEKRYGLLNSIGMQWNLYEDNWQIQFEEAKLFYEAYGHLNVLKKTPLYHFIQVNRLSKKKNLLKKERKDKLESIGITWEPLEDNWNKMFEEAKLFFKENGHLSPTIKSTLYYWLVNNRKMKATNFITKERIEKLENIGIIWKPNESGWNKQFEEARLFYLANGHLNITAGSNLYHFMLVNRISKKKNTISKERIDKLENIGMIWNPMKDAWKKMFDKATQYFKENGNLHAPYLSKLSNWIKVNRKNKAANKLTKERIDLLDGIAMIWKID